MAKVQDALRSIMPTRNSPAWALMQDGLHYTQELVKAYDGAMLAAWKALQGMAEVNTEADAAGDVTVEEAQESITPVAHDDETLRSNQQAVTTMDNVAELRGDEFQMGAGLKQSVQAYFDSLGNQVKSELFGKVDLLKKGVKDAFGHGMGPTKALAFAALPSVISKGKLIQYNANWKNRGYDAAVVAAPITITGGQYKGDYYAGAIINRYENESNKYYSHEVAIIKRGPTVVQTGMVTGNSETSSLISLLQSLNDVKQESTVAAQSDAEAREVLKQLERSSTTQFSVSKAVEMDENGLVAMHNLTRENLLWSLRMGGFPSPSIAVVKAKAGHTKYGPISVVFGRETIDPAVNRNNRLYGSDAWTPTNPTVEYRLNTDAADALNEAMRGLEQQLDGVFKHDIYGWRYNATNGESTTKTAEQMIGDAKARPGMLAAYLKDNGVEPEVVKKPKNSGRSQADTNFYNAILEHYGAEALEDARAMNGNEWNEKYDLNYVREAMVQRAIERGADAERAKIHAEKAL